MSVVVNGSVRERSTWAAHDFVTSVRSRLRSEIARHGEHARTLRSYQLLEHSITPEEIRRVWPHADVEEALRP